jgi:hypothetical protein
LYVFYSDVCIWLQWFSGVFEVCFSSVSEACFKCFNCLQMYVATVVSRCFRSRLGVVSLLLPPSVASRGWEQGRRHVVAWAWALGLPNPLRGSDGILE